MSSYCCFYNEKDTYFVYNLEVLILRTFCPVSETNSVNPVIQELAFFGARSGGALLETLIHSQIYLLIVYMAQWQYNKFKMDPKKPLPGSMAAASNFQEEVSSGDVQKHTKGIPEGKDVDSDDAPGVDNGDEFENDPNLSEEEKEEKREEKKKEAERLKNASDDDKQKAAEDGPGGPFMKFLKRLLDAAGAGDSETMVKILSNIGDLMKDGMKDPQATKKMIYHVYRDDIEDGRRNADPLLNGFDIFEWKLNSLRTGHPEKPFAPLHPEHPEQKKLRGDRTYPVNAIRNHGHIPTDNMMRNRDGADFRWYTHKT